jgi:phosphatidate cytidylyltransferase
VDPSQVVDQTTGVAAGEGAGKASGPSNLRVRIVTALILAPLVLLLLFCGPAWGWALFIALAAGQVGREMLAMTHPADRVSRWVGALMSFGICLLSYVSAGDLRLFLTGIFCVLIVGAMLPLLRLGEIQSAGLRMLGGISAPLYVGVLLSSLSLLRRDPGAMGARYVLFALFVAWTADTGGYAAGRMFGRTKLYEAVSPKKTREGLLGSIVLSVLVSVVGSLTYIKQISPFAAALLGAVGAVLGQMGDLVESLLKRSTGVKDSGAILPGHGGLFDRVDALLIVGPLVYVYYLWFNH